MSRRYDKGLDWVGAVLSTAGIGLLVYDLAYVPPTTASFLTRLIFNDPDDLQGIVNHSSWLGNALRTISIGDFFDLDSFFRHMGNSSRGTRRVCACPYEHVVAARCEDGSYHLASRFRLVGIQHTILLLNHLYGRS